jgi:periodic tryptophan protein 2
MSIGAFSLETRVPDSSTPSANDKGSITSDQLSFRFSNLCGSPYSGGLIAFSSDGTRLFTPVSNRIIVTDLSSNRATAAVPELRSTTDIIVPMPAPSRLVLGIDVDGYSMLFDVSSGVVLNRLNLKGRVKAASFSSCGKYLATAVGRTVRVWGSASTSNNWQFVPLRSFVGHVGDVQSLSWSSDSSVVISAGTDSIIRVWSLDKEETPHAVLNEHSQSVVGAFFFNGTKNVVAVNRAGAILVWALENKKYTVSSRGAIQSGVGYVTSVSFDSETKIMVLGLSGGAFSLFDIASMSSLQSLSVGSSVGSVALARGGDWVAVGVPEAGQLMVWEWRAENFIMKQQGHHDGVNCVAFCPVMNTSVNTDLLNVFEHTSSGLAAGGGLIATGGVEGKVKLWHSISGFCFVTLSDHTSAVEAIVFTPQGNAILSASADGSVRAYDLLRYKNFRTYTAPDARVQFGSVALDPSGDIVAAGSSNGNYAIYLWAMRTGECVSTLVGHEARISSLRFSPSADGLLASTSWDGTLKVWNVFAHKNKGGVPETLVNQREVSCCAFDPIDGAVVAVATVSGHITFWDTKTGAEVGSIDGVRDIGSGRKDGERFAVGALKGKKSKRDGSGTSVNLNQYFSAISYGGAAGRWLAAVSKNSVFVCIYDPIEKVLINRISLSVHAGLSGVKQFLNSKFDTDLVGNDGYDDMDRAGKRARVKANSLALPGVQRGDMSVHVVRRVWRVSGLAVAPDGQELAIATSEGAFVLSLGGESSTFNPTELSIETTEGAVESALEKSDWNTATVIALQLNDLALYTSVFDSIPESALPGVMAHIPSGLFNPLVRHLASLLHPTDGSKSVERSFQWTLALLQLRFGELQKLAHGSGREIRSALCSILQHVQTNANAFGNLLRDNYFQLAFLARAENDEVEDEIVQVKLDSIIV